MKQLVRKGSEKPQVCFFCFVLFFYLWVDACSAVALTGHVQYSRCAGELKVAFVWAQCSSSPSSAFLWVRWPSAVEKRSSGTKRTPQRGRLPSHNGCWQTELELTHDYCVMTLKWASVLHRMCLDCCPTVVRDSSGMTQDSCSVVITSSLCGAKIQISFFKTIVLILKP